MIVQEFEKGNGWSYFKDKKNSRIMKLMETIERKTQAEAQLQCAKLKRIMETITHSCCYNYQSEFH